MCGHTLGALSHPNIATCHGFYEDARYVVMILDFIDGRELKQLLQTRRRLEEAEAAPLMLQAIRAFYICVRILYM